MPFKYGITLFFSVCLVVLSSISGASDLVISENQSVESFAIVSGNGATNILVDKDDAAVVKIAASLFAEDVERVSGKRPRVSNALSQYDKVIIVGTIGKSKFIDELVQSQTIDVSAIKGKWESYIIAQVLYPMEGVKEALVIAGSDRRGTAFGVFSISEAMGVSPWYWWADVPAKKKSEIYFNNKLVVQGEPSVKYRGIFINDEDWGLQPWAAKNMDTDIKDLGPKTYAKVFELLLRLKANYIWPGMHPCTKAFNIYPDNKRVADDYAIVMGSSHCEPMLRNNVTEWNKNTIGDWNYETNKDGVSDYWRRRVKENGKFENVYTVGMRGIHDSGVPGGGSNHDKLDRLETIISEQRGMIEEYVKDDAAQVPQIFCPYKEVLYIYKIGMDLPDDITIVWPDDNHGYVRNLSDEKERLRKGKSGIYYHLSYWGRPQDYLWLSSTSPAKIGYEMSKSYAYGADRLWVFNVGDIKPCEMEMEFALKLAYDIEIWNPQDAMSSLEEWAGKTFGDEYAKSIAEIQKEYYRLTQRCRPEHRDRAEFASSERQQRLNDYEKIVGKAEEVYSLLSNDYKDAYFQLVLYPVKGAAMMERKWAYAEVGDQEKSNLAFAEIQELTEYYNKKVANGKWDGVMDYAPRGLGVYKKVDAEKVRAAVKSAPEAKKVFAANEFRAVKNSNVSQWNVIDGLGIDKCAMSVLPYMSEPIGEKDFEDAPMLSYLFESGDDSGEIEVRFLPTHRINDGMGLRYAITVDGGKPEIINVNAASMSRQWKTNVLRGYSAGKSKFESNGNKQHIINIYMLDPGMVVSQVRIY